jgi:hypothetical protein
MYLRVSYKKKNENNRFFGILKSLEESDPEFDPGPLVRGTLRLRGSESVPKCHGSPTLPSEFRPVLKIPNPQEMVHTGTAWTSS